jgi:conjugative transfer signal peptidase TraF
MKIHLGVLACRRASMAGALPSRPGPSPRRRLAPPWAELFIEAQARTSVPSPGELLIRQHNAAIRRTQTFVSLAVLSTAECIEGRMNRAIIVFALAAAALFWGAVLLGHASGFRINHTPSLPVGLWRIEPPRGPIERGQFVSFCPADTAFFRRALARGWIGQGRCRGGWEPLLKPVIAIPGDRIALSETGITVNDRAIAGSARMPLDAGEIPTGSYSLKADEVRVISTSHPRSLDSRYFRAIARSRVEGIAKPVRVWP